MSLCVPLAVEVELTLWKQQGLGVELELTSNPQWGEHCRKEALSTAALVDKHLSDGRKWILGGQEPTFCDTTLCTTLAMGKKEHLDFTHRFEYLDKYWARWKERDSFKASLSGVHQAVDRLD